MIAQSLSFDSTTATPALKRTAPKGYSEKKKKVLAARRELREKKIAEGIRISLGSDLSNRLCPYKTTGEELKGRHDAVASRIGVYRNQLEQLLKDFAKIPDPRRPKSVKHKLVTLLLYGLLTFVFQFTSRREVNREISRPVFWSALTGLFPELESMPHADTLARVLERIEPVEIERAHINLLKRYIRNKKFRKYLIENRYPLAIDGTQKLVRDGTLWSDEWLARHVGKEDENGEKAVQRYVYVLEASLVFHNGMNIPVLTEFLLYEEDDSLGVDNDKTKQDCELKAFKRMVKKLKSYFPSLNFMILIDGLYANGPAMDLCRDYGWQYMIVLKDSCLKSVWEEFNSLKDIQSDNRYSMIWKERKQKFYWVNDIEYTYENNKSIKVHVIVCEEAWEEINSETGDTEEKHARHVWISSEPLNVLNVHRRCNLAARYRWGIEDSFNTEKNRGYYYEHAHSYDWKAMQCYHFLMRMAHMLNELANHSKEGKVFVCELGMSAFLKFVKETFSGPWLTADWIAGFLKKPFQLRLE